MGRAFVGIGSNLGDRAAMLTRAVEAMRALPSTEVRAVSSFRNTEAVGFLDQPDFLNGAVELATALDPRGLMGALLAIERSLGRDRTGVPQGGPRAIDLEIGRAHV